VRGVYNSLTTTTIIIMPIMSPTLFSRSPIWRYHNLLRSLWA